MFFTKENMLLKVQYITSPDGELYKNTRKINAIPKGTIDHYLAEKSTAPIAENAVKIAQALGVSVEYLVTGKTNALKNAEASAIDGFNLCKRYFSVIQKLDAMPEATKKLLCRLITEWQ